MSIIVDIFCFDVSFTVLFSTVFYIAAGVGGCGWPIYAKAVLVDFYFW